MSSAPLRLALAEDSVLLRDGLGRMLEDEGHRIVASVGNTENLLELVDETEPDLAVLDVRMPPTHTDEGLRAALAIKQRRPQTGTLVLSQYVEKDYALRLLSTDAVGVGYLLKDRVSDVSDFLDAIGRVAGGGTAFDPEVVRQLVAHSQNADPLESLTPREREVLSEMAQGRSNIGIGERLFISQSAVEKNIGSIFDKLELNNADRMSRRVLAVLRYLQQ